LVSAAATENTALRCANKSDTRGLQHIRDLFLV